MKAAIDDLVNRRVAWEALSDLYLDTDVSLSREWRVKQLAPLPYSLEELEQIVIDEVHPVCRWNLVSVAGVWDGFDLEWLEDKILKRLRSPLHKLRWLRRLSVMAAPSDEWRETKAALQSARSGGKTSLT